MFLKNLILKKIYLKFYTTPQSTMTRKRDNISPQYIHIWRECKTEFNNPNTVLEGQKTLKDLNVFFIVCKSHHLSSFSI